MRIAAPRISRLNSLILTRKPRNLIDTRKTYLSRYYGAMATNGTNGNGATATNGHSNGQSSRFDPNFTQNVINLMSPETLPRHREILTSLIRHMHDFCREVELTQEEWIIGVNYVNAIGQAYQKNRNEAWRVCDILGIES